MPTPDPDPRRPPQLMLRLAPWANLVAKLLPALAAGHAPWRGLL